MTRLMRVSDRGLTNLNAADSDGFHESGSPQRIEDLVIQGMALFDAAADEVEAYYDRQMSVAAA